MKRQAGFTLIEVMIVLVIIAIITTIGWPMYIEQGRISNRTDAILATNSVALALTKFESDTGSFTWSTTPLATPVNAHNRYIPNVAVGIASGVVATDITCKQERGFRWVAANGRYESCQGLYSISVSIDGVTVDAVNPNLTGTTFTITTTAIPLLPQARDLECNAFTLDNNGVKGHIAINNSVAISGYPAQSDDPVTMQAGPTSEGAYHSTKRCWGSD